MKLQHDPTTKQQIKQLLFDFLYRPVQVAYRRRLNAIIERNCKLQRTSHPSITYRGEAYITEDSNVVPPRQPTPLHEQLKAEMDEYLKETAYINTHELPYVLGYIDQVLNSSDDLQDYLRLLPESVHDPIQRLIATCGCRTTDLDPGEVDSLNADNAAANEIISQRLTLNLIGAQ